MRRASSVARIELWCVFQTTSVAFEFEATWGVDLAKASNSNSQSHPRSHFRIGNVMGVE